MKDMDLEQFEGYTALDWVFSSHESFELLAEAKRLKAQREKWREYYIKNYVDYNLQEGDMTEEEAEKEAWEQIRIIEDIQEETDDQK